MTPQHKAIFLDRDGTIIVDKIYLNDPEQIEYLPNSVEGLRLLKDAGYKLVVVTNQSGLARGIVDIRNLDLIHEKIRHHFARHGIFFSGFYYAPYSVETRHPFRKPNPGMLLEGASHFNIDLSQSWMIGDRASDVEAGKRAGARTILLPNETVVGEIPSEAPDYSAHDLLESARFILSQTDVIQKRT